MGDKDMPPAAPEGQREPWPPPLRDGDPEQPDHGEQRDPLGWRQPTPIPPPPPMPGARSQVRNALLAGLLVVSLLGNLAVAVRLGDEQRRTRALQAQLDEAEESLKTLQAEIRGTGSDDPLGRIVQAVARLRGLQLKRDIVPDLLTTAQLRERVRAAFLRDNKREEFEANERVLATLGVIPDDLDLWDTVLKVQEEQVAGFYDTDSKELVVGASDARDPSPFDQVLLSHEYTHALTDQHFDLSRLDRLFDDDKDDEATAYQSLVEGDAQLLSTLYHRHVLTSDEQSLFLNEAQNVSSEAFDALPSGLRRIFLFPYEKGLEFVQALHRRGGYAEVDAAYRKPPVSTEQILHPNKYLDQRDDPVAVTMPNVRRALGQGWRHLEEGGVGEFDLRIIADDQAGTTGLSEADARSAAAGWDGGRYVGLGSDEGTLVAVLTAWDSVGEAREAQRLFERWLPLRYRNIGASFALQGEGRGWASDAGAGMVLRNGDRLVILLGPDRRSVERARGAFDGF